MSRNRVTMEQMSNPTSSVPRQNSPQHKICLPRNKVPQTIKAISTTLQQPFQIPIYLNEAQLSMLNSKYSPKDAVKQPNTDSSKCTNTTVKLGTNPVLNSSIVQQQQQQHQLLAQHLHQHQTYNYLNHIALGSNNENVSFNPDHSNSSQNNNIVSYLIPPNLLVSHNQLSQLHPRDLAIIQQRLLHQQHLYEHQQQLQSGSLSNQHLMCTCPSELHRAMHAQQQQQQQQQQRLLEQRKLLATQLSTAHSGQTVKITPVAAATLPRDSQSASHMKNDIQIQMAAVNQPHLCHNDHHHLNLQKQNDSVHNTNSGLSTSMDLSDIQDKGGHICAFNSSADSGYSSNRETSNTDTDSQISNVLLWIESVYGVKIIDYLLKNYSQQIQLASKSCGKTCENNGLKPITDADSRKMKQLISELRKEVDDVKLLLKNHYEFFRDSVTKISGLIQMPDSQKISDRIRLFEYNQAVLAHKIQTVQTSLSTYFSSDEKYQPDVISKLSRNISDINEDFTKLEESYLLIDKPVKVNIEFSNQNIEKYQSILANTNKDMLITQNQLNILNITMSDLTRKQSLIKTHRKIVIFPEDALESIIVLKEEVHRDLLLLTPDLEKRQSACEILDNYLFQKFNTSQIIDNSGSFEDIVDENLSAIEDSTPTRDDSPTFIISNEISCINNDDDCLPPPPSLDVSDESPVPMKISDHMSNIDMISDSILMIDETTSSESFDDSSFNQSSTMLLKQDPFQKWIELENNENNEDVSFENKPTYKTGTILKTGSCQYTLSSKSSRSNKVVFCNTVTVEDGSETIRLNCPSEDSDSEEQSNLSPTNDEQGRIRKNPAPPPPPRRTSQISSGMDVTDGDINYENFESFSSDIRHHILHHNLVCVPLTVKTPVHSQSSGNHSNNHSEQRKVDTGNIKHGKSKSLPCPSENDVWQRQTEYNTPITRSISNPNKSSSKSTTENSKPKNEKPNKKK